MDKKMIRFPCVSYDDEETDDMSRLGMLLDIDLLNCPICVEGFRGPIFQCDNGHLACSSCCNKLRNKCPNCSLPIGNIRCRAIEKMIESIFVQCPNSKYGCDKILSNKDQKTHEQKCVFLRCSCPLQNCNYKGTYKFLYLHFYSTHYVDDRHHSLVNRITFGESYVVSMHITDKMCFLVETNYSLLFVVQCFDQPYGVCVTVKCIASFSHEVGEFSYSLSITYCGYSLKSEFYTMEKIQEVRFENPKEDFTFFPSYVKLIDEGKLKLNVVINKKSILLF